jgi:hypothetical protein
MMVLRDINGGKCDIQCMIKSKKCSNCDYYGDSNVNSCIHSKAFKNLISDSIDLYLVDIIVGNICKHFKEY